MGSRPPRCLGDVGLRCGKWALVVLNGREGLLSRARGDGGGLPLACNFAVHRGAFQHGGPNRAVA